MKDFERGDLTEIYMSALANGAAGKPSVEFDLADFLHTLNEMDAPDEEKLQLLGILCNVMAPFVDMGFGFLPVQQACGQVSEIGGGHAHPESEVLDSGCSERKFE